MSSNARRRLANEMDLKLFNMTIEADQLADCSRTKDEAEAWAEVGRLLSSARNRVRRMMHHADVEKTKG